MQCTVDTGAVATIVHQRVVKEAIESSQCQMEPNVERFVSANGVPVHIFDKMLCDLQIGPSRMQHKIYVSEDLVSDCLLGMDVLEICPNSRQFILGLRKMF